MTMNALERRELSWRGHAWRAVCERFSGARFRCEIEGPPSGGVEPSDLDPHAPSELTIDGVRCRSFSIEAHEYGGFELDIELTASLPLIEFTPHRAFPPRRGDISYPDALARASTGALVDMAEIREAETYWVFPTFGIGSCGVLVEKATAKLVEFGSYTGLENWIWGYAQGLLDDPPRDLVVLSVRDPDVTLRTLRAFVRRPTIDVLPATFRGCAVWNAIGPLREAGDAFAWRCEPSPSR